MNWKQHKLLSISAGLFVILMLAGGGLLFKTRSGYVNQKQMLKSKLGELDKLNKRTPFPNPENQVVLEDNLERVQTFYKKMMETMAEGQVKPKDIEPAQFPALLNESLRRLRQHAKEENVLLPEGFSFGFNSYAVGSLPTSEHVARLTSQVQMVESLVKTIITAGAERILEVEREFFEKDIDIPKVEIRSRRRSSKPAEIKTIEVKDSELYTSETITLSLTGSDQAIWAALNALAAHEQFVVVTLVELENRVKPNVEAAPVYRSADGGLVGRNAALPTSDLFPEVDPFADVNNPGVRAPSANASAAIPEEVEVGPPLSHEERIVAGRESVSARITVNVYQFKADELSNEEESVQEGASS